MAGSELSPDPARRTRDVRGCHAPLPPFPARHCDVAATADDDVPDPNAASGDDDGAFDHEQDDVDTPTPDQQPDVHRSYDHTPAAAIDGADDNRHDSRYDHDDAVAATPDI